MFVQVLVNGKAFECFWLYVINLFHTKVEKYCLFSIAKANKHLSQGIVSINAFLTCLSLPTCLFCIFVVCYCCNTHTQQCKRKDMKKSFYFLQFYILYIICDFQYKESLLLLFHISMEMLRRSEALGVDSYTFNSTHFSYDSHLILIP